MDAAAAVGEAEDWLAAAREEIIAANSALIFARAHEAAVLPLVASTYEELQRLMETEEGSGLALDVPDHGLRRGEAAVVAIAIGGTAWASRKPPTS